MTTTAADPTGGHEGEPRLPLSFGQEQLWFLDQLNPGQPTYNVPLPYRMVGPLDVGALHRALVLVVNRHEILRATFHAEDGTPFFTIAADLDLPLPVTDLRSITDDPERAVAAHLREEIIRPFDLVTGPLLRARLIKVAEQEHVFCLTVHHIVTDGWSMTVLLDELAQAYRALCTGAPVSLPVPAARFADYAARQRTQVHEEELQSQLAYWAGQLADLPVLELPSDRPRPTTPEFIGDVLTCSLDGDLIRSADAFARSRGASVFMVLSAAVSIVLGRYTGLTSVPLGITMLGRGEPELESVVGLFANMVVLRTDLSGDPSVVDLVDRVVDAHLDAYSNQDVPFERVVDRVQPVRDPARNPLFQVAVQMLGGANSAEELALPGLTSEHVTVSTGRSRFDLTIIFRPAADRVLASVEFSTELFDRWRIEAMVGHLTEVLRALVADPKLRLSQLPMLSRAEREEMLKLGRGERIDYPLEPVHTAVARIAATRPDTIALALDGGQDVSYADLDRRAERLAVFLQAKGIGHGQVVAIATERDLHAFVAMLGVLKAGAAYTVLDPRHPPARHEFVLKDSAAPYLLTTAPLADRLPQSPGCVRVLLDAEWDLIDSIGAVHSRQERTDRHSLAYVIYTSGSSGRPKGVMVEHDALMSFAHSYRRLFDLGPDDRMLQFNALTFDMAHGEIVAGLTAGATLVPVPAEAGVSPDELMALMRSQRVSYICLPPVVLSLLDAQPYPDLRKIMVGGEAVSGALVNRWNLPGRRFINVYGPTEAAVGCTSHVCEHSEWRTAPPIGTPHPNRQVYVVDGDDNLVPRGVPGELLVGGPEGLARGYLNAPELTAERFITDPFHSADATHTGRVYRSGDLVRWTAAGELEFLGRIDSQVKLRGLRIELGEIEAVLEGHPEVTKAAVALRADDTGDQHLVGYVTTADRTSASAAAEIREYLGGQLPAYMVPSAVLVLDNLPTMASGKVDRQALPTPDLRRQDAGHEWVAPDGDTQQRVAAIFAEVLSLDQVSADVSFFDLGGNSLQAMRVVSRITRGFGVKLNVRVLYGGGTVRDTAAEVDRLIVAIGSDTAEKRDSLLAQIEQMTEEQAQQLLAERDRPAGPAGP